MSLPRNESQQWTATRLSLPVDADFADFRQRYEGAVPTFPQDQFAPLFARHASWDAIIALTDTLAPFGFMRYWTNEISQMMALAGHTTSCVAYLMGNHAIAERMYRQDPRVMNYAPLRVEITRGSDGVTRFTIDVPSRQFASFQDVSIAAVGQLLDQKVAALLQHLRVAVPDELTMHPPAAQ